MVFLDIRTIVFTYVLTDIICLLVVVFLWRQNRKRFEGTLLWVLDFAFQLLALVLIILRGLIPEGMSIVGANALVMGGALLGYMGLLRFVGERRSQVFNVLFLAAIFLVHAYLTYIHPDIEARSLNTSAGLLVITFQCAWLVLYGAPAALRVHTRGVGVVFVIFCVVNLIRIFYYFSVTQTREDFFQPSTADALALVAYQLLLISLTFALGLMFNKRLVADAQVQEEKFNKAFHSSPCAINLTRLSDGLILEANVGFLKMSGYEYADIVGKKVTDLQIWARDEDRTLVVKDLKNKGMISDLELPFRVKSGERITGLFSAEIITINNERFVLSSINDISAWKRAEELLKQNNTFMERLNNALADATFVVQFPERVVEYCNDAATDIFGYTREEVLGKNSCFFYPDQESYLRSGDIFRQAIEQGKNIVRFEVLLERKSGETFPALFTATFLKEGDHINKMIVIVQDVTEQKCNHDNIMRLNMELEQRVAQRTLELRNTQLALLNLVDDLNASSRNLAALNTSLEAVNKELAAFSYSVSHDLRAPLRSIDGFSSFLQEDYADKLDNEGRDYLARIRRATQMMGQLIDDMLNLSRVTQSELHIGDVDLSHVVKGILDGFCNVNPSREITFDIQDGIMVQADKRLINIALTNLLENAWKFTAKRADGRIQFGATLSGGETVIFIRDNGAGFDMQYVGKLFGAFQRLHKTEEFTGTGIGLATVQRIIHRHGGRIWAEGQIGNGATFYFTLPA